MANRSNPGIATAYLLSFDKARFRDNHIPVAHLKWGCPLSYRGSNTATQCLPAYGLVSSNQLAER
jgi:hypothetical protein